MYDYLERKDGKVFQADRRRAKRAERKAGVSCPLFEAHCLGMAANPDICEITLPSRLQRNPYPPGRRHVNWQEAYEASHAQFDN